MDGEVSTLKDLYLFAAALLPIACTPTAIYCIIRMMDGEEKENYRLRLRNLLLFLAVAETALNLLNIVLGYIL